MIGVGTVLSGDGRILTALSALGGAESADVRYADGTVVHARLGHSDRALDLALLVPQSGKWTEGLNASETDPTGGDLRVLSATQPYRAVLVPASVKGRVSARGKEGETLPGLLDVDVKGGAPAAGTPLLEAATGTVLGVLVHECRAPQPGTDAAQAKAAPCLPASFGVPVTSIRWFLSRTPPTAVAPVPWLGIRGEPDVAGSVKGVRVLAVAPSSPAEKGGLKAAPERAASDLVVAVDGQPIDTPEKLSEAIAKHAVGDTVKILVFRVDHFHEAQVILHEGPKGP
jgi:serine protease Do